MGLCAIQQVAEHPGHQKDPSRTCGRKMDRVLGKGGKGGASRGGLLDLGAAATDSVRGQEHVTQGRGLGKGGEDIPRQHPCCKTGQGGEKKCQK